MLDNFQNLTNAVNSINGTVIRNQTLAKIPNIIFNTTNKLELEFRTISNEGQKEINILQSSGNVDLLNQALITEIGGYSTTNNESQSLLTSLIYKIESYDDQNQLLDSITLPVAFYTGNGYGYGIFKHNILISNTLENTGKKSYLTRNIKKTTLSNEQKTWYASPTYNKSSRYVLDSSDLRNTFNKYNNTEYRYCDWVEMDGFECLGYQASDYQCADDGKQKFWFTQEGSSKYINFYPKLSHIWDVYNKELLYAIPSPFPRIDVTKNVNNDFYIIVAPGGKLVLTAIKDMDQYSTVNLKLSLRRNNS